MSRQLACKYALQHRWLKFRSYYAISVGVIYTTYLTTSQPKDRSESSDPFQMFTIMPKIVPWSLQENESNFEKVVLWQLSQVSWNSKTFSAIAKELTLLILRFWHQYNWRYSFQNFIICALALMSMQRRRRRSRRRRKIWQFLLKIMGRQLLTSYYTWIISCQKLFYIVRRFLQYVGV